jgi:hypothetical protein
MDLLPMSVDNSGFGRRPAEAVNRLPFRDFTMLAEPPWWVAFAPPPLLLPPPGWASGDVGKLSP